MIYDLALALQWLPDDVRRLRMRDVEGIAKAANRRDRRAARKGR